MNTCKTYPTRTYEIHDKYTESPTKGKGAQKYTTRVCVSNLLGEWFVINRFASGMCIHSLFLSRNVFVTHDDLTCYPQRKQKSSSKRTKTITLRHYYRNDICISWIIMKHTHTYTVRITNKSPETKEISKKIKKYSPHVFAHLLDEWIHSKKPLFVVLTLY